MASCGVCKKWVPDDQTICMSCKLQGKSVPVVPVVPVLPQPPVTIRCSVCTKSVSVTRGTNPHKFNVCSKGCYDILTGPRTGTAMLNFLFSMPNEQFTGFLDDFDLGQLGGTSKGMHDKTVPLQVGSWYGDHDAKHYDSRRGEVTIPRDEMLQIAIQSYTTALKLKGTGKPVILYRVSDKASLTQTEENEQTVAGAVRTVDNLWPVERTAAWIQGGMRARIPFVLLTDPRGVDALVGGKDKLSDAVYVREIFQILQTHYTISVTATTDLPVRVRNSGVLRFKLVPPDKTIGPLPLIPRMSRHMGFHHTWDSSKSSLALSDDDTTSMAAFLKEQFDDAGPKLRVPEY
jgi:hypothetical protein